MEPNELMQRLKEYGADMSGINDRFVGDDGLFDECLAEFLGERNFDLLAQSLSAGDYGTAFEAAHALKGLSGNLGLTPFYVEICALTELLRQRRYVSGVEGAFERVNEEKKRLEEVYNPESAKKKKSPPKKEEDDGEEKKPRRKKKFKLFSAKNNLLFATVALLLVVILFISILFCNLVRNYQSNITYESSNHLTEINYQLKLYIEEKIENDWNAVCSIANSIRNSNFVSNDEKLFELVRREIEIWGISEVGIYTEDGHCVNGSGEYVGANDESSEMIYKAVKYGEYMTIVDSAITYMVTINTDITVDGSRIVAVSAVLDVAPFLDRMGFSSFDGEAFMYLTQKNGEVISKLTHKSAMKVYNIMSYLDRGRLESLFEDEYTVDDIFTYDKPAAYITTEEGSKNYVVSTPIKSRHDDLRLFYVVPEKVVNKTTNAFSSYMTVLSGTIITAFAIISFIVFLLVFRVRKKEFNDALRARDRMFALLVENTGTAFALFDLNEVEPLYISDNAKNVIGEVYLGIRRGEVGYYMENESGEENEAIAKLNSELEGWDGKSAFRSSFIRNFTSTDEKFYAIQIYPVNDKEDEYVAVAIDVTNTNRREEAVRTALEMAETANKAKSHFLSNMSHDIRTPMNAIVNMTDFAIDSIGEPRRQSEYLKTIRESSDHLLRLINDVLDMSRIESGQAVIEKESFDLKDELNRVSDMVRPLCKAKKQTFISDFDSLSEPNITGDRLKVAQVLMNLLSNAVKFTPENGAVRFTVSEMPSLSRGITAVRFVVEDNGIGIPEESIEHIFEPFTRVENSRVSKIEGTGLGLSICKSYVTAMGGTINCESEEGNGSVFTVEMFFAKADGVSKVPERSLSLGETPFLGKRCLLCEDNRTNQTIAKTLLEKAGFMVEIASDGREGVLKFQTSGDNYYDIIYMDIQMPVLDGYLATAAIRESPHPRAKDIPIIAMTANVFAEDIEKARLAGMNGHLGKPIIVLELIDETYRVLKDKTEE